MSTAGPSPVIPLLLVLSLSLFIYGPNLMEVSFDLSELQETMASFVFLVPILLLLVVTFMTEKIILPFLLLLVVFFFRELLVGPLILLGVIYFLGKHYSSGQKAWHNEQLRSSGSEAEGIGLGCFILMVLFVILFTMFYQGENYWWYGLMFGFVFLFFFSMY